MLFWRMYIRMYVFHKRLQYHAGLYKYAEVNNDPQLMFVLHTPAEHNVIYKPVQYVNIDCFKRNVKTLLEHNVIYKPVQYVVLMYVFYCLSYLMKNLKDFSLFQRFVTLSQILRKSPVNKWTNTTWSAVASNTRVFRQLKRLHKSRYQDHSI